MKESCERIFKWHRYYVVLNLYSLTSDGMCCYYRETRHTCLVVQYHRWGARYFVLAESDT